MATDIFIRELQKYVPGSVSYNNFWMYHHSKPVTIDNLVNKPCRINACAVIICTRGTLEISCNFRNVTMHENSVFISLPHNSLHVVRAEDSEGYILAMEESSITDYTIEPKYLPELIDQVYESPLIELRPEETHRVCKALDMIMEYISSKPENPFKGPIVKSGMTTFAYLLLETIHSHTSDIAYGPKTINREKEHFNRFLKLLSENYLKEREVRFYAEQMNLTPRYLTTTVRKASGHTVSDWIYMFIIKDAKYLLKHRDMTVQQVAYELNFPNQSFFGKFFKKHVGMSPGAYRELSTSSV